MFYELDREVLSALKKKSNVQVVKKLKELAPSMLVSDGFDGQGDEMDSTTPKEEEESMDGVVGDKRKLYAAASF